MTHNSLVDLHRLVWTALMAALIGASAYLIVPIGPVPVSMQPLVIFLAGYVLGPKHGALAVGLYLLAGTIGLPVFSGGKSGLGHLIGPTGGYLFGFAVSAFLCGLARTDETLPWFRGIGFGMAALLVAYGAGGTWLKFALNLPWAKAWAVGVLPFIPWDAIKVAIALASARYLMRFNLIPGQR